MLVHPSAALRSKLNYEQYRQREVAVKGLIEVPAVGVPGERVSPGEALERGLNYAQYRPDDDPTLPSGTAAEVVGDPSLTMPTTGRRQAARAFVDRGMGGDTDTILANAGRWAGPHLFTLNLLFSADPGLVALVAATGSDPETFTRDCTDQFVCDLFHDRGWGETVAFSYIVHVNHDEQGRLHPHAHITAPGTIVDENGERQKYPYIDKVDTLAAQQVADQVVEFQLDRSLGPDWRQHSPEYLEYVEKRAAQAAQDVSVATGHAAPAGDDPARPKPDAVNPAVLTVFRRPETEPPLHADEASVWISGLSANVPSTWLDNTPNVFTDHSWDAFRRTLPDPVPMPPVVDEAKADRSRATKALANPWQDAEKALPKALKRVRYRPYEWHAVPGVETPELALAVSSNWDPERGEGLIVAHARYLSQTLDSLRQIDGLVYRSSVAEQLFDADGEETTMAEAMQAAEAELAYWYAALQTALRDDPAGARRNLYQAWYQTVYRDNTRNEDSYLFGAPADVWPDEPEQLEHDLTRLPGLHWVSDPRTGDQYSVTFEPPATVPMQPDEETYQLVWYRQWRDEDGAWQLTGRRTPSPVQTLDGSARFVQQAVRSLEADFERQQPEAPLSPARSPHPMPALPYPAWLVPYAQEADWVQSPDDPWVAYALRDRSDVARDWSRIDLVARWYDPQTHTVAHSRAPVISSLPTDYADLEHSGPDSYAKLRDFSRSRHEQDLTWAPVESRDDLAARLTDFHQLWLETTAFSPQARARGFLPALPAEHLPPGLRTRQLDDDPLPLVHALPDGTFGIDYPRTDPTYAIALRALASGPAAYRLSIVKSWYDEHGRPQHVTTSIVLQAERGTEENLELMTLIYADVKEDVTQGMRRLQAIWAERNQKPAHEFLTDGPPNPFDDLRRVVTVPPALPVPPLNKPGPQREQTGQPRRDDRQAPERTRPDHSTPEQAGSDFSLW